MLGVEPTKQSLLPTGPEAARTINHSDHYTTTTSLSGQKHSEPKTQPNYDDRKRKIHGLLDRTNRIPEQNGNISLNRQYNLAAYLTTVSGTKLRRTLTKYRVSEHNLAVEVGWHRQTWLPRKERFCSYCDQGTVETELHFLTYCNQYDSFRDQYFAKIMKIFPDLRLPVLLGDREECCRLAARYEEACHELRNSVSPPQHIADN